MQERVFFPMIALLLEKAIIYQKSYVHTHTEPKSLGFLQQKFEVHLNKL